MKLVKHYDLIQRRERSAIQIGNRISYTPMAAAGGVWRSLVEAWNRHRAEMNAALGGCECCGSFWRLDWRPSMTAYSWNGEGENPNRKRWFCEPCAGGYEDFWQSMWDEYHASQG